MRILRIVDQATPRRTSGKQQGEFAFKDDRTHVLLERQGVDASEVNRGLGVT